MPQEPSLPEVPAKPRVSAVIVSCNCEEALRRCVGALEASKERDRLEILVVDAGSRDACPRIDAEFPKVTVLRLPMNFGKTRARNIGMRTAQADLILFLDPHVELSPTAVPAMAEALETHSEATAVAPLLEDASGQAVEIAFRLPSPADFAGSALRGAQLPRAAASDGTPEAVEEFALLVRRTFIAGMNYLDEKRFSEHWGLLEVCWQIRNAGKTILLLTAARATLHPITVVTSDESTYTADRISGAAAYITKHFGFGAGISFKIKCFLSALGSFRMSLALAILTGRTVDPTQG